MSYVVSARKYRPSRFDEVVGQEHIAQTLKNALKTDRLAHAFLFCGPRGVGKTTCARILAKILNCQNPEPDHEPCNACPNCKAFQENASFNIIELDAASNNSVEHMRALIDQVRFQPQQGKYKIFIIDEVHMLSSSAFNAFLKTLEEPPPYAVFILATTEKHKIIPTILSRCQIYDFKRIDVGDIVAHLHRICQQERLEAENEALHVIALKADGALRDALSIFDRMASSGGQRITYEAVIRNLNVLDYDYYFRFTDALILENLPQVMVIFDQILRNGFEPDQFVSGLAEHFRNLLVCLDAETLPLLELGDTLRQRYRAQAELIQPAFLLSALGIASECDVQYKMARNKRLHTEIALMKMTYLNRVIQVSRGSTIDDSSLPEKKTPDLTQVESVRPSPQPKSGGDIPRKGKNEEPKTPPPSSVAEPEPPATSPAPDEAPAQPKFLNLDLLTAEVAGEVKATPEEIPALTLENLKNAWLAYAAASDIHTRTVLENAELTLEGNKIIASVGSTIAQQTLAKERALMEYLRQYFHHPELVWETGIAERLANAQPKVRKTLTTREKLIEMAESNPAVMEAFKRFDLQMED
jgi:DNA polymerase-3 subunit gamma/tau